MENASLSKWKNKHHPISNPAPKNTPNKAARAATTAVHSSITEDDVLFWPKIWPKAERGDEFVCKGCVRDASVGLGAGFHPHLTDSVGTLWPSANRKLTYSKYVIFSCIW